MRILVIIPAFNEARAIGRVIGDLPCCPAEGAHVSNVVVVNNASTDETAANARAAGATVLNEERRGYGSACLRGLRYAAAQPPDEQPDLVVFLDGDYSDHPDELPLLVTPILRGDADFTLASRIRGQRLGRVEAGAMLPQARLGNRLACFLMRHIWDVDYTDLGPFRAIRFDALRALNMTDPTFGWTIEMQIKAAEAGLRICEVPASYRRRTGVSKITGTVMGTLKASTKILWTIFRLAATRGRRSYAPTALLQSPRPQRMTAGEEGPEARPHEAPGRGPKGGQGRIQQEASGSNM